MKTYNEHYQQCKMLYQAKSLQTDVLDLFFADNVFDIRDSIFDKVSEEVGMALEQENLVAHRPFSKYIKDPRKIPSIKALALEITEQVEQHIFGCHFNIEFVHCYENLHKNIQEASSWLWHFDNCPDECIKIAFHINNSTANNGCMKILLDKNNKPVKMKTDRLKPKDKSKRSSRMSYEHINSLKQIGYKEKLILGNRGSNFVFSPNILHKATIPAYNEDHRKILMFYVRPSLTKHEDPFTSTRIIQDGVDVKEYKLN